jgi:hypothetical protein
MRDEQDGNYLRDDRRHDRWRMWRVTEPEPEYVRTITRRRRARGWRDLPARRWWHV